VDREAFLRLKTCFEKGLESGGISLPNTIKTSPMNENAARAPPRLGMFTLRRRDTRESPVRGGLRVKDWKGELWPEALYMIGESLRAQGKEKESFAYYQRIYVLYAHYKDWSSKAYLRCAEISEKLGLKDDAKRTLEEMQKLQEVH
jgi:hypothetical protein